MQKNLVITIEKPEEGLSLDLKTTSNNDQIILKGDQGSFSLEELEKAIQELKEFIKLREYISSSRYANHGISWQETKELIKEEK